MSVQDFFLKYVHIIEIETSSFCNRTCSFCGNAVIDRHSEKKFMSEKCYTSFLNTLAELEYNKIICFNRYNEPFADRSILDRIAQARQKLPKADLICFSNSDYLDAGYLDEICAAGLNVLNIQSYSTSKKDIRKCMDEILEKIGIKSKTVREDEVGVEYLLDYPGMTVTVQYKNFTVYGNPRGGLIKAFEKDYINGPCYQPLMTIVVDHTGDVMPCCHLRSDYEGHTPYILGNINKNSITEVYGGSKAKAFRKRLLAGDRPTCCQYCGDNKEAFVKGTEKS